MAFVEKPGPLIISACHMHLLECGLFLSESFHAIWKGWALSPNISVPSVLPRTYFPKMQMPILFFLEESLILSACKISQAFIAAINTEASIIECRVTLTEWAINHMCLIGHACIDVNFTLTNNLGV